jgi:hypothetical protein
VSQALERWQCRIDAGIGGEIPGASNCLLIYKHGDNPHNKNAHRKDGWKTGEFEFPGSGPQQYQKPWSKKNYGKPDQRSKA